MSDKRVIRYVGASDAQVEWGSCQDPRPVLEFGRQYEVERCELHSWHTKVFLIGVDSGKGFPSAAFDPMPDVTEEETRAYCERKGIYHCATGQEVCGD